MKLTSAFTTVAVLLLSSIAAAHPADTLEKKQADGICVTACTGQMICPSGYTLRGEPVSPITRRRKRGMDNTKALTLRDAILAAGGLTTAGLGARVLDFTIKGRG
ncbi:hypothetical protein FQN54_006778 [Arachnomyces sp. PD_36]|nr:hypothetical protein FQN54_006778 [Arachnomyces sp. PD_36]